jgi:Protein of unknown function (DUF3551)
MRTTDRILTFIVAAASIALGLCFDIRPGRAAYGDAPWCFVKTGGDDAYQDCQYDSFQACIAAAGVGRGFCNVNPSGPPAPAASQPGQRKRRS